jgi:hypothetical protein
MNANPLVLDIETLPLAAALELPYPRDERTPPSNYKNPDAIEGWYERDERDWRDKRVKACSINPRLGRVLCMGVTTEDNTDVAVTFAKSEAEEPKLLRAFWETMAMEGGEVVTWNGQWDLNFMVIRSMVHKITPTIRPEQIAGWFRRYSVYPHFDCRAVLTRWQWGVEGEGLHEWAGTFGLPERPETIRGLTGGDVSRLYAEGKITTIEEYCGWDVKETKHIYETLAPMYDAKHHLAMRLSA